VETYVAANDDDEDGLQDGTAVSIAMAAGNNTISQISGFGGPAAIWVRAFEDPAQLAKYRGSKSTKPGAGAGIDNFLASYLDKTSDNIGNIPSGSGSPTLWSWAGRGGKDDSVSAVSPWGLEHREHPRHRRNGVVWEQPGVCLNYRTVGRNLDLRNQGPLQHGRRPEYRIRAVS
jgi:hypothetical protein